MDVRELTGKVVRLATVGRIAGIKVMSESLICPDCGGVIGAKPGGDVQVCQCLGEGYAPSEASIVKAESKAAMGRAQAKVEKICRVCGKNLSGHRRLKDSHGYICLSCAKSERADAAAGLVACGECGRKLKPAGLIDYHGVRICRKCFADHQELSRFKAPPPKLDLHNKHEKESLKRLLIIGGVLLVIIIFASFKWLG
jgi:hypothetical protein